MSQDIWVVVETLRGEVSEITYVLLAAGREVANGLGGQLTALLLGQQVEKLAVNLGAADRIVYVEHPALAEFSSDAYRRTISGLLRASAPRLVLFGHTSMGMDIASGVSIDLDFPLVSSCQRMKVEDGQPTYSSLTCGGKIFAEGPLPEPGCVVTILPGGYKPEVGMLKESKPLERPSPPAPLEDLRVTLKQYFEPAVGDVDIAKQSLLVAIGRGLQSPNNVELAQDLANALGGVVCGSRPVVDQGWLPLSRLVGKSGKNVKPKLYLALGISGAPEHTEGMSGAELIVAVNTDEKAPIYDLAQYGAAVDVLELLPILTDKVKQARGG